MSMRTDEEAVPEVVEATEEEGWQILDTAARRHLGMSAREFLDAWDRGQFDEETERPSVSYVAMLIPFVR